MDFAIQVIEFRKLCGFRSLVGPLLCEGSILRWHALAKQSKAKQSKREKGHNVLSNHSLSSKVTVLWLKIIGLGLGSAPTILSHETATLPFI